MIIVTFVTSLQAIFRIPLFFFKADLKIIGGEKKHPKRGETKWGRKEAKPKKGIIDLGVHAQLYS